MSLSNPKIVYGVHSFAAYNRNTGLPYGIAKVLGNSSFSISGELTQNFGGSQKFAWAIEEGNTTAEISLTVKQIESWMFELFLGKAPTDVTTPNSSGAISTLTNVKGSSATDATTGIASVGAKSGSESDMKFGKYKVKAVTATTVDVYVLSDVDFNRGTSKEYEDDGLKITSSPLTIPDSGSTVEVPGFGLEFTGGSGTVAMTPDDTAEFEVHPPFERTSEVEIGGSNDTFPEFGALMVAQQRGNGEMFEIDAYRVKGSGLPLGLQEKAFAEPEITAQAFYDSAKNAVAKIRWVEPS